MDERARRVGARPVSHIACIAVFVLVAAVTGTLATSGRLDAQAAGGARAGPCEAGAECQGASETGRPGREPSPSSESATEPNRPPPAPSEDERSRGKQAAQQVRDHLGYECAWYRRLTRACDEPPHPRDLLDDLSPGVIDALFDEFGDHEIRRLLEQDGVVDVLKSRAGASLLHHLEDIAPRSVEPDFTDVLDGGRTPSDPATGWGAVQDGRLFGPGGQPELDDIDQGSIRDCWWLAGMGALANTDEGRAIIKRMIRQNPNGTYTVTFPDTSRTTVTPYFPIKANGTLAYARPTGRPPAIWPLVLEKALADMRGSYGALVQGDGGDAMRILTGTPGESWNPAAIGRDRLERWLDEGGVTILTPNAGAGKEIYEGDDARLNTDHVYVVQGLTDNGEIRLYNPWGRDHATITLDEFHRHFEDVDFNPIR